MNIFAYSGSPMQCALWLDDKRKNKMILETAQLLCTRGRYEFGTMFVTPDTYKSTHVNHPCSVWLRQSWSNYLWLSEYWDALLMQWGKPHLAYTKNIGYVTDVLDAVDVTEPRTPFVNCARSKAMGLDFTSLPVHDAYRDYHKARWDSDKLTPTWNRGQRPDWY